MIIQNKSHIRQVSNQEQLDYLMSNHVISIQIIINKFTILEVLMQYTECAIIFQYE